MNQYWQRIDRNLGIITREEQEILHKSCVAIAGCGGMGGHVAAALARVGVGKLKIADSQDFDISNLNRQLAAKVLTIGSNKAEATYKEISDIVKDVEVEVFSDGVHADNVEEFVSGADIICDEIEFFELSPRILLHKAARQAGIDVFNCNVIGWGTRIFLFTPNSMQIEDFLEADENTKVDDEMVWRLVKRLAPDLPADVTPQILEDWVVKQHRAPIFGGTPIISAGILVDRLCLHLFDYKNRPWIARIPPMPGYGYFDAGKFEAGIFEGKWW